jgi:hypothetical protein
LTNLPVWPNIRRIQLDVVITSDESELHRLSTSDNEQIFRQDEKVALVVGGQDGERGIERGKKFFGRLARKKTSGLTVDLNLNGRTSTFIFSTPGPYTCGQAFYRKESTSQLHEMLADRTSKRTVNNNARTHTSLSRAITRVFLPAPDGP